MLFDKLHSKRAVLAGVLCLVLTSTGFIVLWHTTGISNIVQAAFERFGPQSPDESRAADPQVPLKATVRVDASRIVRRIPRTLYGTNIEWRWNALNLWLEKEQRPDRKLIELTRNLGVTLIRYPGGFLSDFYHWRDGIGPLAGRQAVLHEPGREDRSRPFFGTDEAIAFARDAGAELWITANAGTGTAEEAAGWVKYANRQGQRVRYWEVGNELYIQSPLPIFSLSINPETYAKRFGDFARAMRAEDPTIKIAAIGGENQGRYNPVGYPGWLKTVLERQAQQIDYISLHNAYAPVIKKEDRVDLRTAYKAMLAAPILIGRNLRLVSGLIEKHAPERQSSIKIAVTEWGPAFSFDFDSEWVDHIKTLGSALFSASLMKTFLESPRVEVANFQMLHDFSVFGAIGSRNTDFPLNSDWIPTARYYAFQLYTQHFGEQLVTSTVDVATFDSQAVGYTDAVAGVPYLDLVSSLSLDGSRLYVIAINKNFDQPIDATISIQGFAPATEATAWILNGKGLDANTGTGIIRVPGLKVAEQTEDSVNPRFSKGSETEITFSSENFTASGSDFVYRFPAHSATSLVLTRK